MTTLLQINASVSAGGGNSSKVADAFVSRLRTLHPDSRLIVRDLAASPLPHLCAKRLAALFTPSEQSTSEQKTIVAESDELIAELQSADIVVLGLPMHSFGVSSQLQAYFDHLVRAGVTFRDTANGPEGLIGNRKLYVLVARGHFHKGMSRDTQTLYVRDFLNFIGIRDVEFVYADELNPAAEYKSTALAVAQAEIEQLAA